MNKFFRLDSPLMILLRKIADLLIVNIIWLLCSIPVITIGASTTALYYVCFKIVNDEETYITKMFFREFKANFKQATLMWILIASLSGFLIYDILLVSKMQILSSNIKMMLEFILILFAVVVLVLCIYTFALQSYFNNTIKNTMKNAIIFGISYLGYTILMIVVDVLITIYGVVYFPIIVPALPVCINTLILKKVFAKHLPENNQIIEE